MLRLRYYVGLFLLTSCAAYGADKTDSPKLKVHVLLPAGSKFYTESREFYITFSSDNSSVKDVKEALQKDIISLAQKKPTCTCGYCQHITLAGMLTKDKHVQLAWSRTSIDDSTTIAQLKKAGFKTDGSALYAQFEKDERKQQT